jgi:glucose-1-phosphate adenylyltransferase
MIDFHEEKEADVTISVINVKPEEAVRFGILETNSEARVIDFEEKPPKPKSTLASMGVYVFRWEILREYLIMDHENTSSSHDFGKDILPGILNDKKRIFAYNFKGYWKDVGTILSYWEANMELTNRIPSLSLYDQNWRIYTPNPVKPAHFVSPTGKVKTSVVAEGCMIHGEVKNSVLFPGVTIGKNSIVENTIIMSNTVIGEQTVIKKAIIAENSPDIHLCGQFVYYDFMPPPFCTRNETADFHQILHQVCVTATYLTN